MKAVKIRLRPSINHMWDGDEVTFLTTTPQDTLNEWLTKYYEPLENFRFLIAKRNNEGCLVSKTNPDLRIFIETAYIEPTNPRNVLQFGTPKKWQPAKH